jgi:hypothetical protein
LAEEIEKKAIDTLRFAVNSLLLDAEHAKEYNGRLLSFKGWVDSEKSAKKKKKTSLMGNKKRPFLRSRLHLKMCLKLILTSAVSSAKTPPILRLSSLEMSVNRSYLKWLRWLY